MTHPHLVRLAALLLSIALAPGLALGQAAPSADSVKRVGIRRMLELQNTDSLILVGIEQGMAQQTPSDPDIPPAFAQEFSNRLRRDIGVFVDRLVPIYDSLYTAEDVRQLVTFYESPLGQRLLATQPRIAEAMMPVAEQWGVEVAAQVMLEMARSGQFKK
jgi:uncharacterized protein